MLNGLMKMLLNFLKLKIIVQDLLAILGGYIGAVNIPEKWSVRDFPEIEESRHRLIARFPGKVDLVFNSHNIMHVLVSGWLLGFRRKLIFSVIN